MWSLKGIGMTACGYSLFRRALGFTNKFEKVFAPKAKSAFSGS
jgi:hypothetical protein